MIRGSEYMASIPVLRAPVIETNIEDFCFQEVINKGILNAVLASFDNT